MSPCISICALLILYFVILLIYNQHSVGRDLPGLSREDLVRFGIPDYGMCIRILEQIDGLANLPTPGSSLRSARSGRLRPFPNYLPQEEPGSSPASEAPSEELVEDDEYLEEENDQFMEEENEKLYGPVGNPENVFYEDNLETPMGMTSSYGSGLTDGRSYPL